MSKRPGAVIRALLLVLVATGALGAHCPPPNPRPPGPGGSARWAWNIAAPLVGRYAADAELRQILCAQVAPDGRLPANTGTWSFVAYSPSKATELQVTVASDGGTSTSERDRAAPGPGIVRPLPASWADSTVVFAATNGHRSAGATIAQLCVANLNSYPQAPGQAVWAIHFDAGRNQLVKADGTYLGED